MMAQQAAYIIVNRIQPETEHIFIYLARDYYYHKVFE